MRRYSLPFLFALLTFALSLAHIEWTGWRNLPERQGDHYLGYAAALVQGEGYVGCPAAGYIQCEPNRGAYRLPGYPLFLAVALVGLGLDDPVPGLHVTQILLASATVALAVAYAQKLAGWIAGIVTGLLLVLTPYLYQNNFSLLSEPLFMFWLVVLLYALTFRQRHVFWLGVLTGVTLLTRGTLLLTVPFLFLLFPRRQWARFALGLAIIVAPISLRNTLVLGAFVPLSTGTGDVLYGANNPYIWDYRPGYWIGPYKLPIAADVADLGEVARDKALIRAALDYLTTTDVGTLARLEGLKLAELLRSKPPFVLVLSGIGAAWLWQRQRRAGRVIAVLWLGLLVNTLIFYGSYRFLYPYEPTLAVTTSVAIAVGIRTLVARRETPVLAPQP